MTQRTNLLTSLIIAICGTVVLGADRLTAKADSSFLGQAVTHYTFIGIGLLALAALWFFIFNRTNKKI